jgi:hypothetical protein
MIFTTLFCMVDGYGPAKECNLTFGRSLNALCEMGRQYENDSLPRIDLEKNKEFEYFMIPSKKLNWEFFEGESNKKALKKFYAEKDIKTYAYSALGFQGHSEVASQIDEIYVSPNDLFAALEYEIYETELVVFLVKRPIEFLKEDSLIKNLSHNALSDMEKLSVYVTKLEIPDEKKIELSNLMGKALISQKELFSAINKK